MKFAKTVDKDDPCRQLCFSAVSVLSALRDTDDTEPVYINIPGHVSQKDVAKIYDVLLKYLPRIRWSNMGHIQPGA